MANNDGPKVFGDGDLTVALAQNGQVRVYAGQRQIGLVQRLKLEASADSAVPTVEFTFPKTGDAELDTKVEEYARVLKAFPWIRVVHA